MAVTSLREVDIRNQDLRIDDHLHNCGVYYRQFVLEFLKNVKVSQIILRQNVFDKQSTSHQRFASHSSHLKLLEGNCKLHVLKSI